MAKSSINFKAVASTSELHNTREVELDYNYPELSKDNESWISESIQKRRLQIEDHCKEVSGRKMQTNATPIREAVVNLESHHTMKDLQNLAQDLRAEKGIECFQIHIHRDEGKNKEDLNYHAHMVFDWQNKETGKMLRLGKVDMSQIQTKVASSLQMERGELKANSNRERLEPIEFKRQAREQEVEKLQEQVKILEQKKNKAIERNEAARSKHEAISGEFTSTQEGFKELLRAFLESGDPEPIEKAKCAQIAIKWLERIHREAEQVFEASQAERTNIEAALRKIRATDGYKKFERLNAQIRQTQSAIRTRKSDAQRLEKAIESARNRQR